jgi:hypothetical protein
VSKFLNKKEQVIDFKLTNYGHYLLSVGKFKPVHYAFYDDNVLYDGEYAGITGSQNSIRERVKDNTQYLEGLTLFNNLDYTLNKKSDSDEDGNYFDANVEATLNTPTSTNNRFNSMIGDAHLDGDTQNAPAWKLVMLQGEISSSTKMSPASQAKVTQINIDVNYSLEVTHTAMDFDPETVLGMQDTILGFADNEMVRLVMEEPLIYGEEINTQLFTENFDIEVFEIITIIDDTTNVTSNTLNRKYFAKKEDDVVDGLLIQRKNKARLAPTTDMSGYYFDVLVDHEINEQTACQGAEVFNKDSYYVDLDFDCDQFNTDNPVTIDIYGRVTEPEICLD